MTASINYYVELLSRNDIAAYVALGMAGLVLVLGLIGFVKGATRGIGRQGVRTVTVVISAVLSYFATRNMLPLLVDFFEGKTMLEMMKQIKVDGLFELNEKLTALFANIDTKTMEEILNLPLAVFVLPLCFAIIFIIISAMMLLIHICVSGILGYIKERNNFFTRLLGALLGLVQGVLVAAVILVPVTGITNVVNEAKSRSEEPNAVITFADKYLCEVSNSPIHKTITKFGGEKLFQSLTTIPMDKEHIDARESVYNILHIMEEWQKLGEANLSEMNEEQQAHLTEIVDTIGEDPSISTSIAALVRSMLATPEVRESILAKFDEPFRGFFNEWISVLAQCNKDTLREDMDTLLDVLIIMAEHDVLEAFMAHDSEAMKEALTRNDENGENVITLLVNRFNENDRTAPLVVTLARLSLTLMAGDESLNLDEESLDTFNNVKEGLTESVLTLDKSSYGEDTEAYINDVAEALDTTLTENGITLDDGVIDTMAQYISDNNELISELETMDDATLTNILIQYYLAHPEVVTP